MKKGISLIALTTAIVIMVILLTTVTISGIGTANNSKKISFATEIASIQDVVDSYVIKTNGEYPVTDSVVVNTTKLSSEAVSQFSGDISAAGDSLVLQKIDYSKIGITTLKYGQISNSSDNDIYALSTTTGKVYYVKGLSVGTKKYFALTDELRSAIDYSVLSTSSDLIQEGIIFTPSSIKWTNSDVDVTVKIPVTYSTITVLANNSTSKVSLQETNSDYYVYKISGMSGNYTVQVNYTKDSVTKSAKYDVDNVDKTAPTLTVGTQKILQSSSDSTTYAYIDITEKKDDISGVKVVKYENENIPADKIEDYFKNGGKEVTKDIIPIDAYVQNMTIYIEDKAGNYAYINNLVIDTDIQAKLITGVKKATVNAPELATGMTPVKWNGSSWVSVNADDPDWYDYTAKKWANAMTADGSLWVWIPRYEYNIQNPHTSTAQTININFLLETSTTNTNGYIIHPAFTFGNIELKGIWVAKFEASGSLSSIASKPGVSSLRGVTIGDIFTACRNMESTNGTQYGWGTTGQGIDTHLMKNVEWGAVTYLTQSVYGKNSEVWKNPNSSHITGQAGTSVSAASTATTYPYNDTTYGVNASTTGNIYGIYDMSGGAWEYTAAYLNNGNSNLTTYGLSLTNADSRYIDVYAVGSSDTQGENYAASLNKKGDALYETSTGVGVTAWYNKNSYFVTADTCFFIRGGTQSQSASASNMFSVQSLQGLTHSSVSFRPTITVSPSL